MNELTWWRGAATPWGSSSQTSSSQRSHYCNNAAFAGPCHDSRVSAFHRRVGTGGTRSPDALSAAAKPGPSEPMTMFDIFVPLCSVTNHTRLLERTRLLYHCNPL